METSQLIYHLNERVNEIFLVSSVDLIQLFSGG